jgi:hypothetical protein
MSSDFDPTDFVDNDFRAQKLPLATATATAGGGQRAPTREEVDSRVAEAHQKLAELKRAQEELERERASLEETRRRQLEFQTGRQELIQNLTRGLGLLDEAEFAERRDAEQLARAVAGLRDSLGKLELIRQETWTEESFSVELTRALTTIENARMEWNSARLKFPVLSGQATATGDSPAPARSTAAPLFTERSFLGWCRIGLALTWPVALAVLLSAAAWLTLLFRH